MLSAFENVAQGSCVPDFNAKFDWVCTANCDGNLLSVSQIHDLVSSMARCAPLIETPNNNLEGQLNLVRDAALANDKRMPNHSIDLLNV